MNPLVLERNIEQYADRLRSELDAENRTKLKALLIEEERQFGFNIERLDKTNHYIVDCDDHIEKQQAVIERLRCAGHDLSLALQYLSNLNELRSLFEQYRLQILIALDRYPRHRDARMRARVVEENSLTVREKEVLSLLAQGNSTEQAADTLGIAKRTLDFHVQAILGKLDVANRTQAVAVALDAGIIKFS